MIRHIAIIVLAMFSLSQTACSPTTQNEQQTLVDRAALAVQEMMTQNVTDGPRDLIKRAKGALICPRVFGAGFFFGASGGSCVLLSRTGNGTWSYPAFYSLGSGSFGLQIGAESSELLIMIMTDKGLNAVLDSQVKLGATAGLAIANLGGNVQGSTTTAVGADIAAFSLSSGLFGGIAVEGSVMSSDTQWNQAYYARPLAARQIVTEMQANNPGADPLRDLLTRWSMMQTPAAPMPAQPQPGYAPAYPPQQGYKAPSQPPAGYAPASAPVSLQPPPGYTAPTQPPGGYMPQGQAIPSDGRGPIQQQSLTAPN